MKDNHNITKYKNISYMMLRLFLSINVQHCFIISFMLFFYDYSFPLQGILFGFWLYMHYVTTLILAFTRMHYIKQKSFPKIKCNNLMFIT